MSVLALITATRDDMYLPPEPRRSGYLNQLRGSQGASAAMVGGTIAFCAEAHQGRATKQNDVSEPGNPTRESR
ncbi:hypothetical protein GGTG_03337 [Gaeumannomyces tritici R3-111a-1]|uniref:Uncharacterized protein n=1 Tax=Gaeumannomyces tritici (strain R3-111a-1) TaxID=644352 RepID=J3NPX9_GAET3|nr:hypothetical protein GGTG_03337 [Gaeumannomyces tritici R3-111a-1]EJT78235.1 hypothetical protein GGTG_03337 [Gaeumannomyces tritici R3-111a-1]